MKQTWEIDVLRSFAAHTKGCATDEEIYETIRGLRPLTPRHLRPAHGHPHAYHNDVRSYLSNLCQKGELKALAAGLHRITPKGRERISGWPAD
jgi:hypothetical protein